MKINYKKLKNISQKKLEAYLQLCSEKEKKKMLYFFEKHNKKIYIEMCSDSILNRSKYLLIEFDFFEFDRYGGAFSPQAMLEQYPEEFAKLDLVSQVSIVYKNLISILKKMKMKIKFGLMALYPDPLVESEELEILHFCGYEQKPGSNEIKHLHEELKSDESFGLTNIADKLVILPAPEDIVEQYRLIIENDD